MNISDMSDDDLELACAERDRRRESVEGRVKSQIDDLAKSINMVATLTPINGRFAKIPVKYDDGNGNRWTGRGRRPRWLVAAIEAGASIEDFRV